MADIHGVALFAGDHVQIMQMDEQLLYGWLVGMTGVVLWAPNQAPQTQVIVQMDDPSKGVPYLSTQQKWLRKI